MSRKLFAVPSILLALTVIVGAVFIPSSLATSSHPTIQHEPSGLTAQGLDHVRTTGMQSGLVTMAPQSTLKLLSQAVKVGPHAPNSIIDITVGLRLRHVARLKQFLQQVQSPGSTVYHQWLTPEQFTARYGPSKADVEKVVAFLRAHGVTVNDVSSNRILIHTEATTEAYEHAFGIEINDYKLHGRSFYSTTDNPKLPRAIAPMVVNVLGLNHGVRMHSHSYWRSLMSAHGLSPRQAPPASLTNMNPVQISHAYNWPDITDGSHGYGVSIAILTAVSSGLAGLSTPHDFWAAFGLPDHTINVIPVGGDKDKTDGMGETLLDVEYAGAMGPGAALNVYVAADASLATFMDMYNQLVVDNNSGVMTTSWGANEDTWGNTAKTADQIFMQAAAQGISMFAAAGDAGSSDGTSQDNMADYPSSSLYVAAANGTQLTISDRSGTYGSEVVWNDADCFDQGPASTGGAISQIFDKPDWQHGPGVPGSEAMRMNSGIALTASCSRPLMVLNDGQWYLTGGTSAVAPQLAGLFAIATGVHGTRLGQSNKLVYDDARNHYSTDFHDVTEGNNGAYEATANWDHPTGWGSVNAQNLISHIGIQGPQGTLTGTVSDASTGEAVADAVLIATAQDGTEYLALSAGDGSYSRVLPAGNFTVSVKHFGYKETSATVTVTDGDTLTRDFSLNVAPKVDVQGHVTDGSGHGYGLYAKVTASLEGVGQVAEAWADPTTGAYTLPLPKGNSYTIEAVAAFNGYRSGEATVDLTGVTTQNFELTVISACAAPGYQFASGGFSQDFNGGTFPPGGWTVANAQPDSKVVWKSNSAWGNDNWTGGTGGAAEASSDAAGYGQGPYDTSLITPPIAVSTLPGSPSLQFKLNFQRTNSESLDVDISTDGGNSWTNMTHIVNDYGASQDLPGATYPLIGLGQYIQGATSIQLRWRYHTSAQSPWDWYAQVDGVAIGGCVPVDGGLVYGQVTDDHTDEGLVGATIMDDLGNSTTTIENQADPDLPVGAYLFFSPSGNRTLTATYGLYEPATAQVEITNDSVTTQEFALKKASFKAKPDAFTLHVMVNDQVSKSLVLSNEGGGTGQYEILDINAPPPKTGGASVPLRTIPVSNPDLLKSSIPWIRAHSDGGLFKTGEVAGNASGEGAWRNLADYPAAIGDNMAARDPKSGKVYSVGGFNGYANVASAFVYDPGKKVWNSWSPIPDAPVARANGVATFFNGKFYVVNGWTTAGNPLAELDIYNSATETWTTGTPNPIPTGGGSAAAILNGKLYIIGGCSGDPCVDTSAVQVYAPATDTWSSAPDYPRPVSYASCGSIEGKLYCAGALGTVRDKGFVYDPNTQAWSSIADIPWAGGVGAAFSTAANGKLVLSGGFGDGGVTNRTMAYNPATDSWIPMPNANTPAFRGGDACGFYKIGGIIHLEGSDPTLTHNVEKLPGYGRSCGGAGIAWLTMAPAQGTLKPGATATVSLTVDGTGQEQNTTSKAYLKVAGAPQPLIVPITVSWEPRPVNLNLSGNVTPTGTVEQGDTLTYNVMVQNLPDAKGAASQTRLIYQVPDNVTFIAASGAVCAPPSGSAPPPATGGSQAAGITGTPIAASVVGPTTVGCKLGTVAPNKGKLVTIGVRATAAASTVNANFKVSAREPDLDPGDNSLTLATNPNVGPPGPPGPTGPQGPKGDEGSGGFGWLMLVTLFGLGLLGAGVTRRRQRR